jgi:Tol biopolymer transport system component
LNDAIWVSNADGTGATMIRQLSASDELDCAEFLTLSPDGKKIAFFRSASREWGIWMMNAEGSGLRRVSSSLLVGGSGFSWKRLVGKS